MDNAKTDKWTWYKLISVAHGKGICMSSPTMGHTSWRFKPRPPTTLDLQNFGRWSVNTASLSVTQEQSQNKSILNYYLTRAGGAGFCFPRICGVVFVALGKIEGGNQETMMTKTPASTPFYWTISPCRLYFIAHPLDSFLSRPGIRICCWCHSYFYAIVVDITYTRRLLLPGWYRKVFFRRSFFFSTCSQWNRILIEIKWDSVIFQTGRVGRGTT